MNSAFPDNEVSALTGKAQYPDNSNIASGTFEKGSKNRIRCKIPRALGVEELILELYEESLGSFVRSLKLCWIDYNRGYDSYEAILDTSNIEIGLYYFKLTLKSAYGKIFGYKRGSSVEFNKTDNSGELFQITVYDFKYNKPIGSGGIIYHIFVDRFNRAGKSEIKPNAVMPVDWSVIPEYPEYPGAPLKNNTFYGGTLDGITQKLDYIKSLGVSALYLSPIFESASNHKYDTADYMSVDSMFGGDEALKRLIDAAREKDISIILDGVFNHTGADSIYFNRYGSYPDIGAYQSKESEYYSWFNFKEYPNKYTCWWDIEILPRINTLNSKCREYFVGKDGVVDKYSRMGIGGFRLDVADELPDNLIEEIKARLNESNSESVLYGEVWEDASNKIAYGKRKRYYLGSELDGVMNYPLRDGIINYLNYGKTSLLFYALYDIIYNAPKRIRDMQMNILGSHDTERILTVLANKDTVGLDNATLAILRLSENERAVAKRKLMLAYTIIATLPGIPVIYYGDEVGLEGYSDPFNRMPYPWGAEDCELLSFYRLIGKIRRENDVYKDGDYALIELSSSCLIFGRYDGEYSYITLINNSKKTIEIAFSSEYTRLLTNVKEDGKCIINAYDAEIFKIKTNNTLNFRLI